MPDTAFSLCPIVPALQITGFCSAHENQKSAGYSYEGESHDFFESLFVLHGCAAVTAGQEVLLLEGGQMIFHPPGEFHRIRNAGSEPLSYLVLSFSADPFPLREHRICAFDGDTARRVTAIVRTLRGLFAVKERKFLTHLHESSDPLALQQAVNQLEAVFLSLLRQGAAAPQARRDRTTALYAAAVAVMREGLAENLTAPRIAAACRISVSGLQKLFASTTGMGAMRYYTTLRMQQARRLLQEGYTVKETALRLGFADQNYFSTVYRRHFGVPPSKERERG